MKNIIKVVIYLSCIAIALAVLFSVRGDIYIHVERYLSPNKYKSIGEVNEYYRDQNFEYVQNTTNFSPLNKQDILNIYYTVINAGKNTFTFFCPSEFPDCTQVIEEIANDRNTLSDINNYVHPFNSFSHIETEYDTHGKVTINIVHSYKEEEIEKIEGKIDELSSELIQEDDSLYNNIKRVHDYIINHSEYDSPRADLGDKTYQSDIAYGPLFQGKAICGGYSDLMQLFLEKMKTPNFKVSSDNHIWNAVKVDGTWLNLDLTWDDPVMEDGSQQIDYKYFLISTKELYTVGQTEHGFNTNHYKELIQ